METERCPSCSSSIVTQGSLRAQAADGVSLCFIPPGIPSLVWNSGVKLPAGIRYCLSCGHLWSRVDPVKVLELLRGCGTELARQHYEALLQGPYHGLPEVPEAREAADSVAEIDKLIIHLKSPEATRRYRELTRTTWDQALAVVASWPNLERSQKLAPFGWAPQEKAKVDVTEKTGHPMRDRWLDG